MTIVAPIISFILCPPQYRSILESFIMSSTLHNKVTGRIKTQLILAEKTKSLAINRSLSHNIGDSVR